MRVTNGMMVSTLMRNLSNNLSRMDKLQQNMATGKKFINPSDDPIGVSRSLRLNTEVSNLEQYKRNVDDSDSWLYATESATNNIMSVLQRARELTVQAANDTNTGGERTSIAQEIEQLRNQLIQTGNTSFAGSYLFSGYKTDKPLLKSDGTYDLGDNILDNSEIINVNVGLGDKMGINFVGQRIFGLCEDPTDIDSLVNDKGLYSNIIKTESSFSGIDTTSNNNIKITYDGVDYDDFSLDTKAYDATHEGLVDFVEDLNIKLNASAMGGHVKAYEDHGSIRIESEKAFSIDTATNSQVALASLGITPGISSTNSKYKTQGSYVDFNANPLDTNTTNKFTLEYDGVPASVDITLDANTYDGSAGHTIDELVCDIQKKINATGLKDKVTVLNDGGKITFFSDNKLTTKQIVAPEGMPLTSVGLKSGQVSGEAQKKVFPGSKTQLIAVFDELVKDLYSNNTSGIASALSRIDIHIDNLNAVRAEIGVKTNRLELTRNRIDDDTVNMKELLSKNEDADMAEIIMNLKMEENVYRASLSGGAKIIQPSLVDFLR